MDVMVWVDMEFTGLDLEKDVILEVAAAVTDWDLNMVEVGPSIAINQAESALSQMDEWNTRHHTESGLIERVRTSKHSHESAQAEILSFVKRHAPEKQAPLCGNSVHQDRAYMRKHMPLLEGYLHYRNVDVSSIKELAKRWYPQMDAYEKRGSHRAAEDIMESIEELRHYRKKIFK